MPDFLALAVCAGDFFCIDVEGLAARRAARVADFLAAFIAFADSAACSFCLSLASFLGASSSRFSSRWIFFFKVLSFIICMCCPAGKQIKGFDFTVKDKSRGCNLLGAYLARTL